MLFGFMYQETDSNWLTGRLDVTTVQLGSPKVDMALKVHKPRRK